MNIAIPLVALAALALSRRKTAADVRVDEIKNDVARDVKKLVQESKEIVQGKRDSYSDEPSKKVTPTDAAKNVKQAVDDSEALRAAQQAARDYGASRVDATKQTSVAKPVPKPAPKPVVHVPAPTPKPTPKPLPAAATPPPGFDAAKARASAPNVAKHIKLRGYDYSRDVMKAFQLVAGIAQDGVYGQGSAAALKHYTPLAPKPLFPKQGTFTYPWGTR